MESKHIAFHIGGSGEAIYLAMQGKVGEFDRIYRARTLRMIRETVDHLLDASRIPITLHCGNPFNEEIYYGIWGEHAITYKDATPEEVRDFDYDSWLAQNSEGV